MSLARKERTMAKWLEKEVVSPIDGIPPIEEWQSARCAACGKYYTTPYMYYFYEYAYCPSCGASMTEDEPQTETEIAKAIVHKMIDDAVIAEDAYPDLRQNMHDAVDEYEPQTEREE